MQRMKMMVVVGLAGMLMMAGGCQNWQKKYETCHSEQENLQALFDQSQQSLQQCNAEKDQLSQQLTASSRPAAPSASAHASINTKDTGFQDEQVTVDEEKGTITVTIESGVLFDSGNVALKTSAKSRLNRIAKVIKDKYSGKQLSVVGHTDADPIKKSKWQDNWELSCERALSVTRFLIQEGVSAKNLEAVGRGEFHPAGGKKAANRRVEIIVHTR
jgi:chemotaxis protein MotB